MLAKNKVDIHQAPLEAFDKGYKVEEVDETRLIALKGMEICKLHGDGRHCFGEGPVRVCL
jgi:hypothetical protein